MNIGQADEEQPTQPTSSYCLLHPAKSLVPQQQYDGHLGANQNMPPKYQGNVSADLLCAVRKLNQAHY